MSETKPADGAPLVSGDGRAFDPQELSELVRTRARMKIAQGVYTQDEVDRLAAFKPSAPGDYLEHARRVMGALNATWDVMQPSALETHRTGLSARIVRAVKRRLDGLMKFMHRQQAHFNATVKDTLDEVFNLRLRYLFVSQRLMNLDERMARLESRAGRVDDLAGAVERLQESLRDVDRQGIFLKRRVSALLDKLAQAGTPQAAALREEKEKLASFDYTLFENLHRGSREEIKRRLAVYPGWFAGVKSKVVDVGCGRGELLELFAQGGVAAEGVDLNGEMVEECRQHGFTAHARDALDYLAAQPDGSLGGISAIQFVEHLPLETLTRFLELACAKLEPGGVMALETVNAACLGTFCGAFYLDMTHVKPIHPLALHFAVERAGFSSARVEYLNPFPADIRLAPLPFEATAEGPAAQVAIAYNDAVAKLNGALFSHADYAVVARR